MKAIASAVALLALLMAADVHAKLYRWVDENGDVHYSDKLPPQASQGESAVLNQRGLTVDKNQRAKTAEEIVAERQAERDAEEQRKRDEAQARLDRVLLQTFSSQRELEVSRDERLAAIESFMTITEEKLVDLNERLDGFNQQAQPYIDKQQEVPAMVNKNIESLLRQIDSNEEFLMKKRTEHEEISAKFERDIARFQELQAIKAQREAAAQQQQ